MIRIGFWPTATARSRPMLTYRCSECGHEDIAMMGRDTCGGCLEPIPDVDLLHDDSLMRAYYHNYGESG